MDTTQPGPTLAERCAGIEMLVVDVDGVLTGGGIVYGTGGLELKVFHVRDGTGFKIWHQAGKRSAIITGRQSPVVEVRAGELGIGQIFQGAADKLAAFRRILRENGLGPEQVCYVGDDLPDVPVLRNCGLAVVVADGSAEAVREAHFVTRLPGGQGAVRETVELILRCQGAWQPIVASYRNEKL